MISREQAYKLLTDNVKNENLVRHCLAVEATMRSLAVYFHEDPESWGIAGLLHDADWETTRETPERHALQIIDWLEEMDLSDEQVASAIKAHNHFHNGSSPPKNLMEWALYCCDELTGLIVACTLVQPEKKLETLITQSVLKKFPQKSFAAGVDRDQIQLCETELDIPLDEFVGLTLQAMQGIHEALGL